MSTLKIVFQYVLVLLVAFGAIYHVACGDDDDPSTGSGQADDADDDLNDDADDDVDDDEESSTPYEFAPPPSDEIGVFVAKTGSDENPGTMEQPKLTISIGVELAEQDGKSVFVAQGEYNESVAVQDVSLFGGYEAGNWQRNIGENTTSIIATGESATEMDGRNSNAIIIEGFYIYGGETSGHSDIQHSSGIDLNNGSFIVSQCKIYGGRAWETSRGIVCSSSSSIIIFNSVILGLNPVIENGEKSLSYPQETEAVCTYGGYSIKIVNSILMGGNSISATQSNGISLVAGSTLLAINNYIFGGYPMGAGSKSCGIVAKGYGKDPVPNMVLINNTIDGGYGLRRSIALSIIMLNEGLIKYNNLWGNHQDCIFQAGVYAFTCLQSIAEFNEFDNGSFSIADNISSDPDFIDPNSDWRLLPTSLNIDAGIDAWADREDLYGNIIGDFDYFCGRYHFDEFIQYDFEGDPRPYGAGWDIGPDEWRP